MEATLDRSTTPWTLRLAGELEIGGAAELKALLLEAVASGQPMQVELEAITGIDVTGLQLLTAAEKAIEGRGGSWRRSGAFPESLRRTADEAGWARVPFEDGGTGQRQ